MDAYIEAAILIILVIHGLFAWSLWSFRSAFVRKDEYISTIKELEKYIETVKMNANSLENVTFILKIMELIECRISTLVNQIGLLTPGGTNNNIAIEIYRIKGILNSIKKSIKKEPEYCDGKLVVDRDYWD